MGEGEGVGREWKRSPFRLWGAVSLPVAVRRSKLPVLKFPTASQER